MCNDVIIVGKNYSGILGMVKSIGEAGYNCHVVSCVAEIPRFNTPDVVSRYVKSFKYAISRKDDEILDCLVENYGNNGEKKILIPTDDYSMALFDKERTRLEQFFIYPSSKNTVSISTMMDKAYQKDVARSIGLNAAKTWLIDMPDNNLLNSVNNITFPCFVKPLSSFSVGASKTYMKKCGTKSELISHLKNCESKGLQTVLIEEYIEFDHEYTIPGVAAGDCIIIPAYIEKLKTAMGTHKGVTIKGRVKDIAILDNLSQLLVAFIRRIGFEGIFDIEVFENNGVYYLNELNLRNSAAGYAVTFAGVNLPGILCDYYSGKEFDRNVHIVNDSIVFISEKPALQECVEGLISWKDFYKDLEKADVRFITEKDDPKPRKAFIRIALKTILIVSRKKIRGR